MPRKKDYNKHQIIEQIKRKRFYVGLTREFKQDLVEKFYHLVETDSQLLKKKDDNEYLLRQLLLAASEYNNNPNSKAKIVNLSIISALIWDNLEKLE